MMNFMTNLLDKINHYLNYKIYRLRRGHFFFCWPFHLWTIERITRMDGNTYYSFGPLRYVKTRK